MLSYNLFSKYNYIIFRYAVISIIIFLFSCVTQESNIYQKNYLDTINPDPLQCLNVFPHSDIKITNEIIKEQSILQLFSFG